MKRWLLVFLIIANVSHGEEFKDYMVQTPKLEAPKRGSLKGDFAELGDKAVSLKTGSFSISLPLKFPSKRGELLHNIVPSYSPSFGISEFGIGWNLNLKVWRMREQGIIDYTDQDMLTGPWGQMIVGDDGYWYSKDLRKKVRAKILEDTFVVYLEDGKVLTFALSEKNSMGQVYAWYLTKVQDKVGHQAVYNYINFSDDGRFYLKEVLYGGLGDDFQYRIQLNYLESRAPFYDYSSGMKLVSDQKIDQIVVGYKDDDTFGVRYHYDFSYSDNFLSPSFYLQSMQKVYYTGESEPAVTFNYDLPYDFLISSNWENVPELDEIVSKHHGRITNYNYVSLNDFNNDGLMDLELDQLYTRYIKTSDGYQVEELEEAENPSSWCLFPVVHSRKPRKFLQIFGPGTDGKVYDLFEYNSKTVLDVCELNGERIDFAVFPKHWEQSNRTIFSDINRDGKADLVHLNGHTIEYALNRSSIDDGVVFDDPSSPQYIDLPSTFDGFWVRDVNGDGQGDLVLKGESTIYVHYGSGDGSFAVENVRYDFYRSNGMMNSKKLAGLTLLFVDMNKDSLPDILMQGDGFVTVHINDGHRFVQLDMPGLFVEPSIYRNMVVADLTGDGSEQIMASVMGNSVITLKLDRPSLGMLKEINDGKGNRIQFEYTKSTPQEGVPNRKTVVATMKKMTTGEGEIDYTFSYGEVAVHNATKSFLGFKEAKKSLAGMGESKSFYDYNSDNLDMMIGTESFSYSKTDLIKFSNNDYGDFSYAGIDYVNVIGKSEGHRNEAGSDVVSLDSTISYDGLCESETIKSAGGKSLTVRKDYTDYCAFQSHLSCHVTTVEMVGDTFSYNLKINRDRSARPIDIYRGGIRLQQIGYGANGLVSYLFEAGKGVTRMNYNSHYMLDGVMAPDGTITSVDSYDLISEEPLNVDLARASLVFGQDFRFDGFGRLSKSWNNLGLFNEATPQTEYQYVYANDTHLGEVFQYEGIETSSDQLDGNQKVLIQSGKDNAVAVAEETSGSFRIKGLTEYLPSIGQTNKYQDYLSAIEFDNLTMEDLAFDTSQIGQEEKDYLGSVKFNQSALQESVYQNFSTDRYISSGSLVSKKVENDDTGLVEYRVSDAWNKEVEYIDQASNSYGYSYDSLGRISRIDLPDGSYQEIYYDATLGKIERIVRSGIGSVEFDYDLTTTLLTEKGFFDSNGALVRNEIFSYDAIGRVVNKVLNSYDNQGVVTDSRVYDYYYDGTNLPALKRAGQLGQMTGVSSTDFEKVFVYRVDGKVLEECLVILGEKKIETFYEYLSHGEISSKRYVTTDLTTQSVISDNTISYNFNRFGKVENVLINGSEFATFAFNEWNDISAISIVGNKNIELNYDVLTRESRDYAEKNGVDTIMRQQWSYNNRGQIENSTLSFGSRSVSNSYSYDSRGFLNTLDRSDDGGDDLTLGYGYTTSGLMNEFTKNGNTQNFILGTTSWDIGGVIYNLDSAGRVISIDSKTFTYGANGRIKDVSTGASYVYDEENNPIYKVNADGTKEVYFEEAVLGDEFILPLKIGSRIVGYLRDNNFVAASADHLNSYVVDENGATNLNAPYGERDARSEASKVIDYALKGYDEDIEAVRMGHRWFNPKAKRFLTADSYLMEVPEECIGNPVSCNLYGYSSNDPIGRFDSSGDLDVDVKFDSDRNNAGTMTVRDDFGKVVMTADVLGKSNSGASQMVTGGNTPTGTYNIGKAVEGGKWDKNTFGSAFISLTPTSGKALESKRTQIGAHGGISGSGKYGQVYTQNHPNRSDLRPTQGCMRLSNQDASKLANIINANRVYRETPEYKRAVDLAQKYLPSISINSNDTVKVRE